MAFFRLALFAFCAFFYHALHAQSSDLKSRIDSLRHLTTDERISSIRTIMEFVREKVPVTEAVVYVDQIDEVVKELNDHRAIAYAMLHKSIWLNVALLKKADAIAMLVKTLKYAEAHNCPNEKADILIELGIQHYDMGYREKALPYFLQTLDFLKENNYQLENTPDYLVRIGDYYYRMGYYEKAAEFFIQYEGLKEEGALEGWHLANCLNTAGLTFKKLKQYDKAISFFRRSLEISTNDKNTAWIGLLKEEIGSVYFEMGNLTKAVPLLEEAVVTGQETELYHSAASAAQLLARVAFQKGDMKKALSYYNQALEINSKETRETKQFNHILTLTTERDIHEGLTEFYRKTGNAAKELDSYQRLTLLKDSILMLNRVEEVKKLEMKHEFEKQEQRRLQEIELLNQEKALFQNKQRATIIIGVLVLLIAGLIFYTNRQRLQKKKDMLQQELDFNKRELQLHTEKLVQKTNAVEELQQQLDNIKVNGGVENDGRTELITQLIESTILTESDWNDFKKIFEQVHHGFFARLRQSYQDLTEGEIRLMALVKLNLSSKEIANMLGISTDSVNKSRYRLRKKLTMEAEASLEEFIAKV